METEILSQNLTNFTLNLKRNLGLESEICTTKWGEVLVSLATTLGAISLGCSAAALVVSIRGKFNNPADRIHVIALTIACAMFVISHALVTNLELAASYGWVALSSVSCKTVYWLKMSTFTALNYFFVVASRERFKVQRQIGAKWNFVAIMYGTFAVVSVALTSHLVVGVTADEARGLEDPELPFWKCTYSTPYVKEIEYSSLAFGTVLPLLVTWLNFARIFVDFIPKMKKSIPAAEGQETERRLPVHRSISAPTSSSEQETDFSTDIQSVRFARRTKSNFNTADAKHRSVEIERKRISRHTRKTLGLLIVMLLHVLLVLPCRLTEFALVVFRDLPVGLVFGETEIPDIEGQVWIIMQAFILLFPLMFPCLGLPVYCITLLGEPCMDGFKSKDRVFRRQKPVRKVLRYQPGLGTIAD